MSDMNNSTWLITDDVYIVSNDLTTTSGTLSYSREPYSRDIFKEIDEIRDILLLIKKDIDMESKYPRLKELRDQYNLELEKYKTFEKIKGST